MNDITAKMDFWLANNFNVMMIGPHGVGKSANVIDAFNRAGLNWVYLSAPTLDPWTDFIGVPRPVIGPDGKTFLEFVCPKKFAGDEVEALLIEEFPRGHSKVKNALMELIQFKSINGRRYNNLRVVWATANPFTEDYDGERLDEAQLDRFHIHYHYPAEMNIKWFAETFGENGRAICSWWKNLPEEIKKKVSPRRAEYALRVFLANGDLEDVLPKESNISNLRFSLKMGHVPDILDKLMQNPSQEEARKFLAKEANFTNTIKDILHTQKYQSYFLPLLSEEKISQILSKEEKMVQTILHNGNGAPNIINAVNQIRKSSGKLSKYISNMINNKPDLRKIYDGVEFDELNEYKDVRPKSLGTNPIVTWPNIKTDDCSSDIAAALQLVQKKGMTTVDRSEALKILRDRLPANPTEQNSKDAFLVLNHIIVHSHRHKIEEYKDVFYGILNHYIREGARAKNISSGQYLYKYVPSGLKGAIARWGQEGYILAN